MKHSVFVLSSLLVLILQSGCAGAVSQQPPAATETQAAVNVPAQGLTESPTLTEVPIQATTEAPTVTAAPQELPAVGLFPVQKPSLVFTGSANLPSAAIVVPGGRDTPNQIVVPNHIVGFVFLRGPAIKAAGAIEPRPADGNLTAIGMVEVAGGAALIAPGVYTVEIDLTSTDADVAGRLVSDQSVRDLKFHRTQLVRNPERAEDSSFPAISPIIASDVVCFIVGVGKPYVMDVPGAVNRYCSGGSTDTNEPLLSVKANFPLQYNQLSTSLSEEVYFLTNTPLPGNPAVDVLPELTISEIEGHSNVNRCNGDASQCTPDIIGAPSATFWNDYDQAMKQANGNNFVVTEGFVRVAQLLEIPGQQTVEPGRYWIRDWFDPQGKLIGTALLGWTDGGQLVNGLTIPATPTYFLDEPGQRQVVSWISGWHCFRWCKWQPWCP